MLIKYHTHLLPVGKNLLRRKHSYTGTCPGCGGVEDYDHLLQCENPEMTDTYAQQCDELETWLNNTTSESLSHSVMTLLHSFRSLNPNPHQNHLPLVSLQQQLGRQAFFAGLWHTSWLTYQEAFHQSNWIKHSATQWILNLIRRIQQLPIHMWRTRNDILHSTTNNEYNKAQHEEQLDHLVESIFDRKPNPRTMAHCDNLFFCKHDKDKVKKMKLRRKINWITGANLILTKYERALTTQSARFFSYFQWDDQG
jgi:hypothetical protein